MNQRREVRCPSGAILKIQLAPFKASKDLYQVLLVELHNISLSSQMEMANVYKELICRGFSSPAIELSLQECFKSCTYDNGSGEQKITPDTFEAVSAREDYMLVCTEVTIENVAPFMKNLSAVSSRIMSLAGTMAKSPA